MPTPRIIVLEDDRAQLLILERFLERKGYEVVSAPDPMMCPVYSDKRCDCPEGMVCGDILLTDNHMPRMTGLRFVERQQQMGCKGLMENKAVLSAGLTEEDRKEAADLGCTCFDKPYELRKLEKWLDERISRIDPDRKLRPLT